MSLRTKRVRHLHKKDANYWMILFLFGFMVGVIALHFLDQTWGMQSILINQELLQRMEQIQLDKNAYFQFVLQERVFLFITLIILATTMIGMVICNGYLAWYGFTLGIMLAALTMEYGIKGILLYFLYAFPQVLLYVPLTVSFIGLCEQIHKISYKKETLREPKIFLVKILILILGIFVAVLVESYINPLIIYKVVKYL
ncbi:MAG: stage II sporulation protein M [Eubacteriales bacterium]